MTFCSPPLSPPLSPSALLCSSSLSLRFALPLRGSDDALVLISYDDVLFPSTLSSSLSLRFALLLLSLPPHPPVGTLQGKVKVALPTAMPADPPAACLDFLWWGAGFQKNVFVNCHRHFLFVYRYRLGMRGGGVEEGGALNKALRFRGAS